jgi:nitroimidazol reductase NimA-like FMN-containing flavoprotein (pyridoxamine 5'-phosphate oxidase superfamily)
MTIEELDARAIDAFLASHSHGRLAYAFRDRVDIEPIHYVWENGWIYGRTAPGTKLTVLQRNPWVAFEVDDVRGPFDWTSVVVKGTVYFVADEASVAVEDLHAQVLERLRRAFPDPGGTVSEQRFVLFRIHVDERRGRRCT